MTTRTSAQAKVVMVDDLPPEMQTRVRQLLKDYSGQKTTEDRGKDEKNKIRNEEIRPFLDGLGGVTVRVGDMGLQVGLSTKKTGGGLSETMLLGALAKRGIQDAAEIVAEGREAEGRSAPFVDVKPVKVTAVKT